MKAKTLSLLATAGFGGAMLLTQAAPAAFVGLEVESKPNAFNLSVCNVYATFDNSNDGAYAVAGTPGSPLSVEVIGGDFYQNAFGTDLSPNPALLTPFPSLAYDTFVTIGMKTSANDGTGLPPGWPGFGASELPVAGDPAATNMGWFVTPDAVQSFAGAELRVLIGQFSTEADLSVIGNAIQGTFLLSMVSDGVTGYSETVSFYHGAVPAPGALALLGLAGLVSRRRRR